MMNEYETWLSKVVKVADFKYDITFDMLVSYDEQVKHCWDLNFSPIRTVETIAAEIFG